MKRVLLAILVLAVSSTSSRAQGTLGIYSETDDNFPCVGIAGFTDVHVIYDGPSLEGISFEAPVPACLTGFTVDSSDYSFVGTSQSGITVGFGGCVSGPIRVLTIRIYQLSTPPECCAWTPQFVQGILCGGGGSAPSPQAGYFSSSCTFTAPHTPSPPNGAAEVQLNAVLDYESAGGMNCDLGNVLIHNLYFGTNPAALTKYTDLGPGIALDALGAHASTLYYWRAEATTYNGAGPYSSPLWSFTTAGPIATEASTWGRIKALYR